MSLHVAISPTYRWTCRKGVRMVRIIRVAHDASRDYSLPVQEADKLFTSGQLHYDATNRTFCHPGESR